MGDSESSSKEGKKNEEKGKEKTGEKGSGEVLQRGSWKAAAEGQAEKGCRTQEMVPKPCIPL